MIGWPRTRTPLPPLGCASRLSLPYTPMPPGVSLYAKSVGQLAVQPVIEQYKLHVAGGSPAVNSGTDSDGHMVAGGGAGRDNVCARDQSGTYQCVIDTMICALHPSVCGVAPPHLRTSMLAACGSQCTWP